MPPGVPYNKASVNLLYSRVKGPASEEEEPGSLELGLLQGCADLRAEASAGGRRRGVTGQQGG
jgi:hypothetical protein